MFEIPSTTEEKDMFVCHDIMSAIIIALASFLNDSLKLNLAKVHVKKRITAKY